jgi:hypothetical protein
MKPSIGLPIIAIILVSSFYIYSKLLNTETAIIPINNLASVGDSFGGALTNEENTILDKNNTVPQTIKEESPVPNENINTPDNKTGELGGRTDIEKEFADIQSAIDLLENPLQ